MASFAEIPFSTEEIDAVRQTKAVLLGRGFPPEKISPRELLLVTLNCKLRPESAADKYTKWMEAMSDFGINTFDDVWEGISRDGLEGDWSEMLSMFTAYAGCGRDKQDRSIMWIRTRPVDVAEERSAIKASCVYFTAIHADMNSLRNGVTFVLDTTNNDMEKKVGNESKLQRTWQSIPLRPQRIFIIGAGYVKRLLINAAITLASFFTKEKVLERIRFADLDEVRAEVAEESLPHHVGGGCKTISPEDMLAWVQHRLADFPPLPSLD